MCLLQKKETTQPMRHTKKSRNNTEKSYSTTKNGMPEGLKFDAAKKKKPFSQ